MGHSSEVKCSSRKGMTLSSNLSREEKGEGKEEKREKGRLGEEKCTLLLHSKHIKKIKLPSKFTATPQYFVYYSSCLVSL